MLASGTHDQIARNIPSTTLQKTMHTVDLHPRSGKTTGPVSAYHSHINAVHIVPSDPSYTATGRLQEFGECISTSRVKAPELSKSSLVTTMYNDPLKYSRLDMPAVNEYKVSSFYDAFPRDKASIALTRTSSGYGKFGGTPYNYGQEMGSTMTLTNNIRDLPSRGYRRASVDSVNRLLSSQYTIGSTAGPFSRDGCLSESAMRNYSNIKCYPTTMESYSTGRVNTIANRRFSEQSYSGLDFYNDRTATLFKDTTYLRNSPFSGTVGLTAVQKNNLY